MDASSRQRINEETVDLSTTTDKMVPTDTKKTFYPITAKYTFFLSTQGTSSKIDHMLGHETSLSELKKLK